MDNEAKSSLIQTPAVLCRGYDERSATECVASTELKSSIIRDAPCSPWLLGVSQIIARVRLATLF